MAALHGPGGRDERAVAASPGSEHFCMDTPGSLGHLGVVVLVQTPVATVEATKYFKTKDSVNPSNRRWGQRGRGEQIKAKHTNKQTWVRPALDTPANVYFKVFLKRRSVTRDFDDTRHPLSLRPGARRTKQRTTHPPHHATQRSATPRSAST